MSASDLSTFDGFGLAVEAESPPGSGPPENRYDFVCLLGRGGMGEVWRVHDQVLDRTVALKMLHSQRSHDRLSEARFVAESRVVAGLQHPGIIPVYDAGTLPDGRRFFTMKEIVGATFERVIEDLHQHGSDTQWPPPGSSWTLRRVVELFLRVCEATGHAHRKGVLHRDLKPANIMVGADGEVQVLDWGLGSRVPGQGMDRLELEARPR